MIELLRDLLEFLGVLGHTAAEIPTDPAGRRAFIMGVIRSQPLYVKDQDGSTVEVPAAVLFAQASVETADFTSAKLKLTNSLFNRHVGSGKGDWAHKVDAEDGGAPLRSYVSLEQSVRDMLDLLADPLYRNALAAAGRDDAPGYFSAIAHGDGINGFVGPANAPKASNYTAALTARYREGTA